MSKVLEEEEEDAKNHRWIKGKDVTAVCSNGSGSYSRNIDGSDYLQRFFKRSNNPESIDVGQDTKFDLHWRT
jgi:hypothetical protein